MTPSTHAVSTGGRTLYAALAYLITLLAAALTGCAVGPDYVRPPVTSPDAIRGAAPAGAGPAAQAQAASLADRGWWEIFPDPTLQALIDEALANGYDLKLAAARVAEARAEAGITRAGYFPAIQGEAGWSRGRQAFGTARDTSLNLTDVQLGLTWEIDVWGRIRRLNEAALARYMATEEARRAVLLSLVSEVASSWFELRELDLQLDIARRTSHAFHETYDLFHRRRDAGAASALETSSAAASLAATNARIPDLERQIAAQENRIALLLGRNPEAIARGAAGLNEQTLPVEIPSGLPSDLLERRPDLREAEQRLVAANADVGVAVANFFPTISLTGSFGGVSSQVSELFGDGRVWSVGAGLLTPVFQGRRLKNEHQAALARWEEAKVEYEQSVTSAFGEVSTALVAYQKLADAEKEQAAAVDAFRQAVDLSNSRYVGGLSDYLEVLQAQQQLFPAENALAATRFQRLDALVQLYKALGGGWNLTDPQWSGPATAEAPHASTAG